jgi:rsbT co-antagonist protein RsbR
MMLRFRRWLHNIHLHDPIEQQQAPIVQFFLLGVIAAAPVAALTFAGVLGFTGGGQFAILAQLLCAPFAVVALALLRRDRFQASVITMVVGFLVILTLAFVPLGTQSGGPLYMVFLLPIILTGLLLTRRVLLLVFAASVAVIVLIAVLEPLFPTIIGSAPLPGSLVVPIIVTFISIVGMIVLLLDRFSGTLRLALVATLVRERELDGLRASLEATVAERTAALEDALHKVVQRETHLAQTLEELRASQGTIQELSAPVIPVMAGVLVAPMVGALDSARANLLTANVLHSVERQRTQYVIFDITGVPLIDTHVAQVLLRTSAAVQLLGAQVLLVGVRPEVAQTMVALNISLGSIATYPDLQQAIEVLLARTGWTRAGNMGAQLIQAR